jgi:hypothetical protein
MVQELDEGDDEARGGGGLLARDGCSSGQLLAEAG